MRRFIAGTLVVSLLFLVTSCTYPRAHINYSDYAAEMPMKDSAWDGEQLGRVEANEAGAIWNECTKSAKGTIWVLIDETKRLGGNAIGDIRWIPNKHEKDLRVPTCKKAWAWFLVWPVLATQVFMSSRAEANAYKVDEADLPRAGLYVIPETAEGQEKLVERILAEATAVSE